MFVYILQNSNLTELYSFYKTYCNRHLLFPGYKLIGPYCLFRPTSSKVGNVFFKQIVGTKKWVAVAVDDVGILNYLQNSKLFQELKRITTPYTR
jgi:hypothetical protein